MINGKTLINLGYKPGKWFQKAIEHCNSYQLEGNALLAYLDKVSPPPEIDPYSKPLFYHKNIEAECPEEEANLQSVLETMDELMKTPTLVSGAIMPDACPTGGKGQIPVGAVVGAKNALHPAMHSADICCSVMITNLGKNLGKVDPKTILDIAQKKTHFGFGGRKEFSDLPKLLLERIKANPLLNDKKSIDLAHYHLGTQGDGNHFLFVGTSEKTGDTTVVTHHGSRGFGAYLYKKGVKLAEYFWKNISPKTLQRNAWIPFDTEEGQNYWDALQIVREWTKLNHQTIHKAIFQSARIDPLFQFWNEHNFVFKKDDIFYHAKGATPLNDHFVPDSFYGQRLIPLNMKEPVLVVQGETTDTNLGFAPHGAGRNISRSAHMKKCAAKGVDQIFAEETKEIDVRFFSGKVDISELPSAYKNAESVQSQMKKFGLGTVIDKIIPYGSIMAGEMTPVWKKRKGFK